MNWLDGEHTCTYKDDSSLSTSTQLCDPSDSPFSSSSSTAGKLFFNYFPYASQWTRVSLLCSSNRCCHMPQAMSNMSNSSNALPLGKFHFIFELFMLQWKFLAGNASKEWQGEAVMGGDYQNKRAIWQIVDLPHSECRAENQLITLSPSLSLSMFPIKNSKRQSERVFRRPSTLIFCWTLIFC